jgi:uncharacterized RDD family membrane protein YckC
MAKIIINQGKPNERTVPLEFETTTLGRASDNVVVLPELYVSRQHLIIEKRPTGYFAHNLSSTTGTFVNQQKIEEVLLKNGDLLTIGETTIYFEVETADERTIMMEQPTVVMPTMVAPAPPPLPPPPPAPDKEAALFCPRCNSPIRTSDVFCGSCGASLKALPPTGAPRPPAAPPRESYSDPRIKASVAPPAAAAPPPAAAPASPAPPAPLRVPPVAPRLAMPMMARPAPGAANYLNYPKAGFGVRLVAYLIDSLILGAIAVALIMIPMLIFGLGAGLGRRGGTALGIVGVLVMIVAWVLVIGISILYPLWFWAKKGYTPGKKVMGLRVITQTGECPLGWGPAFLRLLGYWINGMIACLGFLFILFDAEKRGLHDMIAKTYVVSIK